jgi:hypothetical protein
MGSHGKWDHFDIAFAITMSVKQRKLKCITCKNKRDELYDVSTYCMKILKHDHFNIELKMFVISN